MDPLHPHPGAANSSKSEHNNRNNNRIRSRGMKKKKKLEQPTGWRELFDCKMAMRRKTNVTAASYKNSVVGINRGISLVVLLFSRPSTILNYITVKC